jgi:hypothetical protein
MRLLAEAVAMGNASAARSACARRQENFSYNEDSA